MKVSIIHSRSAERRANMCRMRIARFRRLASSLLPLALIISMSSVLFAAVGDLDASFGVGGKVKTHFNNGFDAAFAVAVQSDGKIVAAGLADNANWEQVFALARYTANGLPDPTFGNNGRVLTDIPNGQMRVDLALQADGKIVVAGTTSINGTWDFVVARFNSNGNPDATFGTNGKTVIDMQGGGDELGSVAIQPDGKIVVVGTVYGGSSFMDIGVARLTNNGFPDAAFGVNGEVVTDMNSSYDRGNGVAVQTDGKIVVVGKATSLGGEGDFAIVRYDTTGNPDPGFGAGGKQTAELGGDYDEASSVVIQPSDGKIIAAGIAGSSVPTLDFGLARFDPNGGLDPAFGIGGSVKTDFFNAIDYAKDVTLQSDGKIVAAGWINPDPSDVERYVDFGVARYNPNGVLDPTFGNGGLTSTDFGSVDEGGGVAIQADCSIVVAGYSWPLETGDGDFALARYQGDGCSAPPPSTTACPRGQGYWKNHPENWPVESVMIGARVYTKAELIALLKTPAKGNASIILSYQLIAAKLNIANGSNGTSVASQIAQADGILAGYTGALPYDIAASSATGQTLTEISGVLDSYNSGDLTEGCVE